MVSSSLLWSPSPQSIEDSNLTHYRKWVNTYYHQDFSSYDHLYQWSINEIPSFWESLWKHFDITGDGDQFNVENLDNIEKRVFFPDLKLNYTENILSLSDDSIAIEFYNQQKHHRKITYAELNHSVFTLAHFLSNLGVEANDRVVGYLPNIPEAVIGLLASAAIGAVWSSCSPDFGIDGVCDRFSQIEPKVLIIADGYYYGEKTFDCMDRISKILENIPSIKTVIVVPYLGNPSHSYVSWPDIFHNPLKEMNFKRFDFNHPLYILYSSGTTGKPKCILHGTGGTLLQHYKEHRLHCDIKPRQKIFYYTTCGWMMWNWLVSVLGSKATIVLYDGSPMHPTFDILLEMAELLELDFFGVSAKYIDSLRKQGLQAKEKYNLKKLKMIASTGSPLSTESFQYVYNNIKDDVCLASISGGTDIVSCFALGNPIKPVYAGELQGPGLGLDVRVYDDQGKECQTGEKGELVCLKPFACQPVGFWNDHNGTKYHQTYFERFPNIWHHGDFIEKTSNNGFIIHGRSDSVLNPGGIRIGTAEIYRQVAKNPEVLESLATGQIWGDDERVILFVKLIPNLILNDNLKDKIKSTIRQNTTPRHVPNKIIQVTDIPKTKNGKLAEVAVHNIINKLKVPAIESLENPECLKEYGNFDELQS